MSAFVVTLDAILAVMVAWLLITMSMSAVASREFSQDDYVVRYAYDFLAVAEKSGALGSLIDGEDLPLERMIDGLPRSICLQLDIYTRQGIQAGHEPPNKLSCQEFDPDKVFIASRLALHEGEVYPTTVKVWYNYER